MVSALKNQGSGLWVMKGSRQMLAAAALSLDRLMLAMAASVIFRVTSITRRRVRGRFKVV